MGNNNEPKDQYGWKDGRPENFFERTGRTSGNHQCKSFQSENRKSKSY